MMGSSENNNHHPLQQHHHQANQEQDQLQTLDLDSTPTTSPDDAVSTSNYRSAITEHPLLSPPNGDSRPSYDDVIFSPHDSPTNEVTLSDESESWVSQDSTEYLRITVSNPQKEAESSNSIVPGGNTYITYLITTSTNIGAYVGSEFSVRRRFRDVVTLSDRLSECYRGFLIPPRPDKSIVESQVMHKQEFVEQRRVELEKYLRRLAGHPVIRGSDELRVFLTVQGRMPLPASVDVASRVLDGAVRLPNQLMGGESRGLVEPQDVVQPAKGGRDLLRYFKELKQSVVNDWGKSRSVVEEEDKEFLEKKEKMWELEQQLTNVSKQAESLVKAQHDMGETMGELGLASIKISKFELEQAVLNTQRARATDIKIVATAAVKTSRLYRELNGQTVNHFDTLHEHMGLMLAAHNAFSDRSSALLTVQTLISELSSLQSRAEKLETSSSKLFGGDNKSRYHKLEELKDAIRGTEDAKSCAVREYERIKENNRSEIQRLDRERQTDFVNMLNGFVSNQVAYNEKIASEWSKAAEETSKYTKESST